MVRLTLALAAEAVIAAQEAKIKWIQDWLAKNGG